MTIPPDLGDARCARLAGQCSFLRGDWLPTKASRDRRRNRVLDGVGVVLALWDWDKLAQDAVLPGQTQPQSFRGATFAWNCATPAEVDAVFAKAIQAGAGLLRKPEKTDYGGYRGYFSDPDGHAWEVVQAPGFSFTEDGRLILPE